jgi:hypothetical protein
LSPVRMTASATASGPVNTPELRKSSRSARKSTCPTSFSEGPLEPKDE